MCIRDRNNWLGLYSKRRSHTTPLLRKLHWQPVQQRIDYKVALLTFKVRSMSTPLYLQRLIKKWEHVHNLRSATTSLSQPSSTTTFAKRAFRCIAPAIWNSLSKTVIDSDSITVFKSRLKTFIPFLSGLLSSLFSLSLHTPWPQCLWSYDHQVLYKYVYYYYVHQILWPRHAMYVINWQCGW